MTKSEPVPQWVSDRIESIFSRSPHSDCVAACRADYSKCLGAGEPANTCRENLQSCIQGCKDVAPQILEDLRALEQEIKKQQR